MNNPEPNIIRWCQTMALPVTLYGCWTWNDQSKVFCYSIWIFANAKPPAEIQDSLTNAGFRFSHKDGDRFIYVWQAILSKYESDHGQEREHEPK